MNSTSLDGSTSKELLHRWPITVRVTAGYIVALVAIGAVSVVSWHVIDRQRQTAETQGMLSRAQRVLQDADMQHDAIRSEVLSALLDGPTTDPSGVAATVRVERAVSEYRQLLAKTQSMPLPDGLEQAILAMVPDVDLYLDRATEIGHLAERDRAAARQLAPEFQVAFDRLLESGEHATDLFAARFSEASAAASQAARSARQQIVVTCLIALVCVGIVSRLVMRSVAAALHRVTNAAQSIADGDFAVRTAVPVRDEVGRVAEAVNRMADNLQSMIGRLRAEQEQDAFSRQLSEALEMSDTEAETYRVVARGMAVTAPDMPMELLVADSSRAHLERATAHPDQGWPGCSVESPYECMAVRRGNPVVFESSQALNACAKLQNRKCGSISAVCVPLSFMGRALGVLHATGPHGQPPAARLVGQLTTLGILAGSRIGTVRAFQRSQIQASTDALTGLPNRRSLESMVRGFAANDKPYAVLLADLDHFKKLNDKFGHGAGDQALRMFADVLRRSLRDGDHPSRWGGEEFAVVLETSESANVLDVVERIRLNLAAACAANGPTNVTASFGISDSTMARNFEQLVRIADDALYRSKEGGRDRATIGDPARLSGALPRRDVEQTAVVDIAELVE